MFQVVIAVAFLLLCRELQSNDITTASNQNQYYLVKEAHNIAKDLFLEGRNNYDRLKNNSLQSIDIFLDLLQIINSQMARELRSAIVKFYKIKYFRDFNNYVISMEEIIDITRHCLMDPIEKLTTTRFQFHEVISNFQDVRNFDTVERCRNQLPDEVAVAYCILHQAVLFNETMQDNLVSIVKIKTKQYANELYSSVLEVRKCFADFVPQFFDQLLIDVFTKKCGYLKTVNASVADLSMDKWKSKQNTFPTKWEPLVNLLRTRINSTQNHDPLFLTLFAANLSSQDVIKILYAYFIACYFINP